MEARVQFRTNTWRRVLEQIRVKPRSTTQIQSVYELKLPSPRFDHLIILLANVGISTNENHDDSSENRLNTCDNGAYWSDLNPDVLLIVMMQLGVFDFVAFIGVCKSWRSLALSNKCKFMASKSPISVRISAYVGEKKTYCYLEDLEGRKYKTSVPHCARSPPYAAATPCMGSTCGYLILYDRKNRDLWLVNPITGHKLHFPNYPTKYNFYPPYQLTNSKVIVVFSCSISKWVVVLDDNSGSTNTLFFSIAGQGTWNCVSPTFPIIDLETFKGRIYTLNKACQLYELRLDPQPELMLLETKNFPIFAGCQKLVSSCKNLYLREYLSEDCYKIHRLNFDEMNWMSCEKESEECAFIHSTLKQRVALKHPKGKLLTTWYIPMIV
ncbi:hypothetical protein LXL04_015233 [Taraxacum kok-saghyz]